MGFINNYTDNFLPTNHPWDDASQKYSVPKPKRRSLSDLDYSVLHDMLEEMSSTYKSMPMCKDKMRLKEKMMECIQEIKKRDEMEEATRVERDDNFEHTPPVSIPTPMGVNPTPIQPVSSPPFMDADDMDMGDDDLDMFETDDIDEEVIDSHIDDDIDDIDDEIVERPNNDTTNLLIAGLIVICVLTIMKK